MRQGCERTAEIRRDIENLRSAALAEASFARTDGAPLHLTGDELMNLLRCLRLTYDRVELIDAEKYAAHAMDEGGALCPAAGRCRTPAKAASRGGKREGRSSRFELVGEQAYYVTEIPLEADGAPCVLELASRITEEALRGIRCPRVPEQPGLNYGERIYIDALTGVYNLRYYREQLCTLSDVAAVAMLNVEGFDRIGADDGDRLLREVAEAVLRRVRRSDAMVRCAEHDFLLVFRSIPRDALAPKLEAIRSGAEEVSIDGLPELRVQVSVGGKHGPGRVDELARQARSLMHKAQHISGGVCMG